MPKKTLKKVLTFKIKIDILNEQLAKKSVKLKYKKSLKKVLTSKKSFDILIWQLKKVVNHNV